MDVEKSRTTVSRTDASRAGRYVLECPTLAAARAAVMRILPTMCEAEWPRLLSAARLTGDETDPQSLARLLRVMSASGHPVLALCARSLSIRLATYTVLDAGGAELMSTTRSRPAATRTAGAVATLSAGRPADTEVALLDPSGVIVRVNQAWHDFYAANGGRKGKEWAGTSYLAVCATADDPYSEAVERAIRTAVHGALPAPATVQIPCHSLQHERWFDVAISSRYADDGSCLGATVSLTLATAEPASV